MDMDIKQILIMVLIAVSVILVISLIVLVGQLISTIKKANTVLDDANRISTVAAKKTEAIDGVIDEAADMMLGVVDTVRGNTNTISRISSLGTGVASARAMAKKFRSKDEEEYIERARARKARKRARR